MGPGATARPVGDGGNIPAPAEISKTMVGQVIEEGRPAWSDDALADARFTEAESVQAYGLRSIGCLPLGEQGVLYLHDPREPGRFPLDCRAKLTALCSLAALVLKVDTRTGDKAPQGLEVPGLVGSAPAMVELYEAVHAFAGMPWPALVLGETGTGKEAVARALHSLSDNADGAFVALNCGAIPDELAESTLFGHVKGAFTGADRPRDGLVARAAGGTLFLDEVGELSPRAQLKLLRLLQEGTYNRVGEDRERRVRARVVAATHQPLEEDRETFRDDLYYRLAACVLNVPPLRARSQDVPALAEHLLDKALGERSAAAARCCSRSTSAARRPSG
ncbi:MAG TPA: sigma 54-interacting transcriptional regulator [Myxococcota bacterium]|nr:sigma 54-interacting transcriptional regulator [Myxococcota bacterium]